MDFTLVTVAHNIDLPLLKLQARSLHHYLARDFVHEIIVVDNSTGTASLDPDELLSHYGSLAVRIIKARDIALIPNGISGWFTQQVYKLLVADHVSTKNYVLLDAKTHLVNPVSRSTFEDPDGRLRIGMHGYRNHTLKRFLVRCCQYFNIDPETVLDSFLQTSPPFSLPTDLVKHLVADIERRENKPFATAFLAAGLTEFFAFGTYLLSSGRKIEDYYVANTWHSSTLWKEQTNDYMQNEIICMASRNFFAVHRASFHRMNPTTQHVLAVLWHHRELFASYDDAIQFVEGCATTYR